MLHMKPSSEPEPELNPLRGHKVARAYPSQCVFILCCMVGWLVGGNLGWLVMGRLVGLLVGWLVGGGLVCWFVGGLVGR